MKKPPVLVILLGKIFPYRFLLAKMTRVPLLKPLLDRLLFDQTNLTYLPKDSVVEIQVEQHLHPPDNIVLPSQVVDYFVREASRRFVMDFCICRRSMDCKKHPSELGCLFLGEAVKDISPGYGKEVSLDEALSHVKKCRQAGLIHLIGRDHIDQTWLQVKAGEKLMTICNCCSCCCLWKWLPDLDPEIRAKVKRMPGVTVTVSDDCKGCGTCVSQCFVNAIQINQGKARISDECRGCGRCVDLCPQHAIRLHIREREFLEKTQERIAQSVKVS